MQDTDNEPVVKASDESDCKHADSPQGADVKNQSNTLAGNGSSNSEKLSEKSDNVNHGNMDDQQSSNG